MARITDAPDTSLEAPWREESVSTPSSSRWRYLLRIARRNPTGAIGFLFLVVIGLVALLAPWIAPYDPEGISDSTLLAPNSSHWFGTDNLGRDVFSRVLFGTRVSLLVGVTVATGASIIGAFIGLVSGFIGGKTDLILQRFVDALSGFPALILALLFVAMFGQSLGNVILAVTIVYLPRVIRTERSVVLSVKENLYVEAARSIGASNLRIMLRHVLPNCLAPVIILATLIVGTAIIIESSLSFLGLGVPPQVPTWGNMLGGQAQTYHSAAPWMAIAPGLALTLTVLAFNLVGDALRDELDPRVRAT